MTMLMDDIYIIGVILSVFSWRAKMLTAKNLITGTRYMNVDGMLPFENLVADYVKETNHHVLYRVTPIFNSNLVASGVLMEAKSVEDDEVEFCVYCYNVQPGIEIDYATGDSHESDTSAVQASTDNTKSTTTSDTQTSTYVINENTKKNSIVLIVPV